MNKKRKRLEEATAAPHKRRKAEKREEESEDDDNDEEEEKEEEIKVGTEDGNVGSDGECYVNTGEKEEVEAGDEEEDEEVECPECTEMTTVRGGEMGKYKEGNTENVSEYSWRQGYRQVLSVVTRGKDYTKMNTLETNASCEATPVQSNKKKEGRRKGDGKQAEASVDDVRVSMM
jgi:hypothetical protein